MKFDVKGLFSPQNRVKTISVLSGTGVAAIIGLCIAIFSGPSLADAPKPGSDQKEISSYLASKEFGKLPVKDRQTYLESLRKNTTDDRSRFRQMRTMPAEQRQQMMNNMRPVFMAAQKEHLDKFFAMSPEDQEKELDKVAERMKQFRQNRQRNNNNANNTNQNNANRNNNNNNNNRNRGNFDARMKMRYEATDSDTRAKQTEYRRRLREKMKQKK